MVIRARGHLLREVPVGYTAHFVIDASVALKWVWDQTETDVARRYAKGAALGEMRLSVPALFWYELANALRYGTGRGGQFDATGEAWDLLHAIPMSTIDFQPEAFPLISALAVERNITVYDASYVFLAQSLTVPLITADEKLVNSCSNLPYVWLLGTV